MKENGNSNTMAIMLILMVYAAMIIFMVITAGLVGMR